MKRKPHTEKTKLKISQALSGSKHPQWKGGRIKINSGYVWVHAPNHPMASKVSPKGYVLEHRLVMSTHLGRPLKKEEVVHHINHVRDDNRIENLMLTTPSEHVANHNKERVWRESSIKKSRANAKARKRNGKGQFIELN